MGSGWSGPAMASGSFFAVMGASGEGAETIPGMMVS